MDATELEEPPYDVESEGSIEVVEGEVKLKVELDKDTALEVVGKLKLEDLIDDNSLSDFRLTNESNELQI